MSIQILDKPGSISGRLGKGLAQGLADTLPAEMQKGRLAYGIENMQDKKLNPLQQTAELLRSGASPQEAAQLLPSVQQAGKTEAFKKATEGKSNVPSKVALSEKEKILPKELGTQQKTTAGRLTPEESQSYKSRILQSPTVEDRNILANEFLASGQAIDPTEAKALADEQLTKNLSSQNTQRTNLRKDVSERIGLALNGAGLGDFKDVTGDIQKELLDRAEYNLLEKGMTPEESAQNISEILADLGRTATLTKQTGAQWFTSPSSKTDALRRQKEVYDNYGFGEIFDDIATASLGITPMKTASLLNPLKNDKIKAELKTIKRTPSGSYQELDEKKLAKIVEDIQPGDNILSIAKELRDKKMRVDQFLNAVDYRDKQKQNLTPEQKRQLRKPSRNSMFGDIWFTAWE